MEITYYGHSCFVIDAGGFKIVTDPYDGSVPGYAPLKVEADAVYCSHEHEDHNFVKAVKLSGAKGNPFNVTELSIPHDDKGGALRGPNTVRIFECDGKRIAHMGDIGCRPTADQLKALEGLDLMLVPIGGYFTIDSKEALWLVNTVKPKMVIPMHFRDGGLDYPLIADIKDCEVLPNQKRMAVGESIKF